MTDIIISQSAATEGNQQSLDFIPGSNFLGIVASQLYNEDNKDICHEIFHSGKVRFGDAHPSIGDERGLRIPAAWYTPKLDRESEIWVHHRIKEYDDTLKQKQLKQCRSGFYTFNDSLATKIDVLKSFAIKSAYDSDRRGSKEGSMFGYESIAKGVEMIFEVAIDDDVSDDIVTKIEESLIGDRRVGSSRSAQYGVVKICKINSVEPISSIDHEEDKTKTVVVYADSRLIFLDKYGLPTFTPSEEDFGLTTGNSNIDWSKSQIRTFQYAPWNAKRQTRDADRCGIEKGSVIVITDVKKDENINTYVGLYQNEGFGHIHVNPAFLNAADKGQSNFSFKKVDKPKANTPKSDNSAGETSKQSNISPLLCYLKNKQQEEVDVLNIYKKVNEFVTKSASIFTSAKFASQWGKVRSIAALCNSKEDLINNFKVAIAKGVRKSDWDENERRETFMKFVESESLNERIAVRAVVNLASEMGKLSKEKEVKK